MRRCFDMVTSESAAIMGLDDYGLAVGKSASLVVLDAGDPIEAIRLRAERLCVIAKGKVVSTRERRRRSSTYPAGGLRGTPPSAAGALTPQRSITRSDDVAEARRRPDASVSLASVKAARRPKESTVPSARTLPVSAVMPRW